MKLMDKGNFKFLLTLQDIEEAKLAIEDYAEILSTWIANFRERKSHKYIKQGLS